MKIQVKKLLDNVESNICLVPSEIFDTLKLSINELYNVHLGQLNEHCYIKPDKKTTNEMYISRNIFNKLLLYSDVTLNIWKKDKDIYLGPVVGVFVNTKYIDSIESQTPKLGAQKHMQANTVANCLTYYFSIENINWIDKKIKGYTYIPSSNEWKRYWLPMPDVIYDRGVKFNQDDKSLVKHIREQFNYDLNIKMINNSNYLGSKWKLHKDSSKYIEVKAYLPETIRYTGFKDVIEMIDKYGFVFLKSFYGARGREVLSIEKGKKSYILYSYKDRRKEILLDDKKELNKYIDNFIGEKKFIVQQGIRLLKLDKRRMSMRILIEKNEHGKWEAIYNQLRIAKKDFTITNRCSGGDVGNYSDIYSSLNSSYNKIYPTDDEIRKVAIKIATYIEKEYGLFGELGIDMVVDENGEIWLIEVNTKPNKNPREGIEDTKGISPQFLSILKYSKFLVRGDYKNE